MSDTTKFEVPEERVRWYEVVRKVIQSGGSAQTAIEAADAVLEADRSRRPEEMKRIIEEVDKANLWSLHNNYTGR